MTFSLSTFTVSSTLQSEVGVYPITMSVCDGQPLCSTLTFTVTVINDPPTFVDSLVDQTVQAGQSLIYKLPATFDLNGDSVTVTATELGKTLLPSFVIFDGLDTFIIAPIIKD